MENLEHKKGVAAIIDKRYNSNILNDLYISLEAFWNLSRISFLMPKRSFPLPKKEFSKA